MHFLCLVSAADFYSSVQRSLHTIKKFSVYLILCHKCCHFKKFEATFKVQMLAKSEPFPEMLAFLKIAYWIGNNFSLVSVCVCVKFALNR